MNDSKKSLLPALLAAGGGLAAIPASALELGEITIESTLGQPLRASIAYALGPNEQLAGYCISLNRGLTNDGLPAITRADVSVANGVIALSGAQAIREPLMSLKVSVNCPYTPSLSRAYMLFFDPALPATAPAGQTQSVSSTAGAASPERPAAAAAPGQATSPVRRSQPAAPAARRASSTSTPVDASEPYRVQRGDTLSEIAARIENRPVGLWNAVAQIFDANPDAFIDDDPNKLKAGSLLVIPQFGTGRSYAIAAPASTTEASQPTVAAAPAVVSDTEAQTGTDTAGSPNAGTAISPAPDVSTEPAVVDSAAIEPATSADRTGATPEGDASDVENPFVDVDSPSVVIPDTQIEAPTTATSPNVPTARIEPAAAPTPEAASTNWLLWLGGGGVALILGLLLFGRRKRKYFDYEPMKPVTPDNQPESVQLPEELTPVASSYEVKDDAPTEENLALDADLIVGTGLQDGGVHVNEDFGFAAETELDLELPEDGNDDTADMSVIMDASQIREMDETTERELPAIPADEQAKSVDGDGYTVSQEIDFEILARDYEEELTATQALSKEIEKAAAELAETFDKSEVDELTSELQLATVSELDMTGRLPANDADMVDEDLTFTGEELTLELDGEDDTVQMAGDEGTVEMPVDGDTVQMPRKSHGK